MCEHALVFRPIPRSLINRLEEPFEEEMLFVSLFFNRKVQLIGMPSSHPHKHAVKATLDKLSFLRNDFFDDSQPISSRGDK